MKALMMNGRLLDETPVFIIIEYYIRTEDEIVTHQSVFDARNLTVRVVMHGIGSYHFYLKTFPHMPYDTATCLLHQM